MKKLNIKVGDKFGKLTVIGDAPTRVSPKGRRERMVMCKCECGNGVAKRASSLVNGRVFSCGCNKGRRKTLEGLVGKKYGSLTVLEELPPRDGRRVFRCKCDCGKDTIKEIGSLLRGKHPSCGCMWGNSISQGRKGHNTYVIEGDITKVIDLRGRTTLVDTQDLDKIKPYYFYQDANGYFVATCKTEGGKRGLFLHRYLTDCPKGKLVDHINHNRADNRKQNLKVCDYIANNMNHPFIGVAFLEHINKWQVAIKCADGIKYCGVFDTFDEAVEGYRKFTIELIEVR